MKKMTIWFECDTSDEDIQQVIVMLKSIDAVFKLEAVNQPSGEE